MKKLFNWLFVITKKEDNDPNFWKDKPSETYIQYRNRINGTLQERKKRREKNSTMDFDYGVTPPIYVNDIGSHFETNTSSGFENGFGGGGFSGSGAGSSWSDSDSSSSYDSGSSYDSVGSDSSSSSSFD